MFGLSTFAQSPFASLGGSYFPLDITEDVGLADTSSQIFAYSQSVTESINAISDVINDAGVNYFGSATEAITSGDSSTQISTFLQSIAEDLLPEDTPTIAAQFAISRTEDFTPDDSSAQYFAAQEARSEPIDSVASNQSITANFPQSPVENIDIADTPTSTFQYLASISEPITLDDVNDGSAGFAGSVTEDMGMADIIAIANAFLLSITEDASYGDSYTASQGVSLSITEGFTSAEIESIGAQFVATINEIIVLTAYSIEKGWVKINDSQTANWSTINDGQSPGWAEITFTQSANWTKINDGQ